MNDYDQYLAHVCDSGVGRDGIPYAAWRQAGKHGRKTLSECGDELDNGRSIDFDWNDCLQAFLGKGDPPSGMQEWALDDDKTRALGLRNTDNKICAGVRNHKLRAVAKKSICKYQNGFVWQRNFPNNPVALDALGRIFQTICPELNPAIVSWDFAAAFPSISHEFLFMVFRANGMPTGM